MERRYRDEIKSAIKGALCQTLSALSSSSSAPLARYAQHTWTDNTATLAVAKLTPLHPARMSSAAAAPAAQPDPEKHHDYHGDYDLGDHVGRVVSERVHPHI